MNKNLVNMCIKAMQPKRINLDVKSMEPTRKYLQDIYLNAQNIS